MQVLTEIGLLLESMQSSFETITNRPTVLSPRTLLVITGIYQSEFGIVMVNGYIAEFLIDGKVSVIPTGPDDTLCLEEILVPEQEFVLAVQPGKGTKFIRFCGRNI